jgi:hypothetical protein
MCGGLLRIDNVIVAQTTIDCKFADLTICVVAGMRYDSLE